MIYIQKTIFDYCSNRGDTEKLLGKKNETIIVSKEDLGEKEGYIRCCTK